MAEFFSRDAWLTYGQIWSHSANYVCSTARRNKTPYYFSNRTKKDADEERVAQRLKIREDIVYELKKNKEPELRYLILIKYKK